MKILGINGSSPYSTKNVFRPYGGSTLKLLNKVIGAAEAEAEFLGENVVESDIVHLHEVVKGFYPGNYDFLPDYIVPTFAKMIEADAMVFASPVQWYLVSDYMKAFINHLTALECGAGEIGDKFPGLVLKNERQLAGKVIACIATCHHDGAQAVNQQMRTPLDDMGCITTGGGASYYRNGNWVADPNDEDGDWQNIDWARVGQNLARETIKQQRTVDLDVNNWEAR